MTASSGNDVLGIFGGTFDPVHDGHLKPVRALCDVLGLERVHFVPAATPPHRDPPSASVAQRVRMLELALADEPFFVLDRREIERAGVSYTVDTLESFRAEYGPAPLALIVGADSFAQMESWHRWPAILELAHLIVLGRPGWSLDAGGANFPPWARERLTADAAVLLGRQAGRVYPFTHRLVDISATRVRAALAGDAGPWLPRAVMDYIRTHGLYGRRHADASAGGLKDHVLRALEDAKAVEPRVLDVRRLTDITDFMIVATGTSDTHVRAVAERVRTSLAAHGERPMGTEGEKSADWVLLDYGDVVVHVMLGATRSFYDLEKLWGEAVRPLVEARRD